MEIRTGSLDSNSSRHKWSSFESVQRRSNESQYCRKEGSGVKRELKEKGISFKIDQGERQTDQEEKQKWSPKQQMRRRHNKEDQLESEEAKNISTGPTSKSKQDQAAGIPEAEVANNRIARRGKDNSNRSISLEVLVGDVNYKS
ncbi:hypothetical protein TNCV_2295791 [Trichonephila clavipes]|nr:hypothetical protein TNCV_2295791 [Trichonephila clavipes]